VIIYPVVLSVSRITRVRGNGRRPNMVKVKVWTLAIAPLTRDQQRFTISEVAADWHEPMVPQRIMWPSIARAITDNWTHGAASRHTIARISHTRPSPRSRSYY